MKSFTASLIVPASPVELDAARPSSEPLCCMAHRAGTTLRTRLAPVPARRAPAALRTCSARRPCSCHRRPFATRPGALFPPQDAAENAVSRVVSRRPAEG